MGHELLDPGYDPNQAHAECSHDRSGKARSIYSQRLVDGVKAILANDRLDLIFTYFDDRNVLPESLDEIRRFGVPMVNFFCNAAHEFYKIEKIASHYDYCIVPERSALESYYQVDARPIHLQMAANPRFYMPADIPYLYDVSFIGTKYFNREEHLLQLSRAGMNVHAFGSLWLPYKPSLKGTPITTKIPRRLGAIAIWPIRMKLRQKCGLQLPINQYHGPVSDEEMVRIFNQSRVVLGLSDVIDPSGKIIRHIRLRDFEAPMSGAFYMTGYQAELSEYYEIGKEIECYDCNEELVEKARFYLDHDAARIKIAKAGFQRARQDHTWERRFEKLFYIIGIPNQK